jgi:NADH:quinone reductase (non-electrogenic)
VTRDGIYVGDDFTRIPNIFWAAGVKASGLGAELGAPLDRHGRVLVERDLSLPGRREVFVIGDMAAARCAGTDSWVPGVAQAAIQMGRHAAAVIEGELGERGRSAERVAFVYRDRGSMAVIGKAKAVVDLRGSHFGGGLAWLLWGLVHIFFLIGFRNRLGVFASWFWNWLLNARDARLITGDVRIETQ